MTTYRATRAVVLPALLVLAGGLTIAQQAPAGHAQSAALNQRIPVDPEIATGRLANGLRYFVRTNRKPEKRAELRLVVNAGSILEEDDQLGLAHFVEHMAFNGTKHFPKQELVAFMQSIGMRFGPSVNAFTSFDETVYMLQVPTDKPGLLERAFLILEDWAQNVSFDPAEIDKERGVILEEWRLRRGAAARMQDQQFPVLLKGSRYAERLPIGRMDIVQTFSHDRLKQFYADWYRPDLMAVVAVGDFDRTSVERLVRKHFGSIPPAAAPTRRPSYSVPDHPGTLYGIATDPEASSTTVTVYSKRPVRDQTTVGAYRRQLAERLFTGMLSVRFSELAQKPDAPFLAAGGSRGLFVRTKEASTLSALAKEGAVTRALEALFTEAERVARFGFTASELERQKRERLRSFERALAEKDNQVSGSLAAEYIRHFTQREPIPGIAYEHALSQRFLPEITLEEVNNLARNWVPDRNRVVLVSGPRKEGLTMPDERRLAATIASVARRNLTAYVDAADTAPLLDAIPEPGRIVKTVRKDEIGITEWELSNGVRVVLKPTTFKEDEVVVRATSPGGHSLAANDDFIPASTAASVIAAGGLGQLTTTELRKVLSGKIAAVRPFIGETEEGLTGSASPKDLETMFQLIYLTFTQPRADRSSFGIMQNQMKATLANQKASPEVAFGEMLQSTLTRNHPRARRLTPDDVGRMDLEKSLAFYKERFADASDFTFVVVGSFDQETIKPFVERYLGSLPSLRRQETWKDLGIHPPTGTVEKRVTKGIEPKSRAGIVFTGPFEIDPAERVAWTAMADVLQNRLREALREELGGTYTVGVPRSYTRVPRPLYRVSIDFTCDPGRVEELVATVFREIELLKANGPTEKQVNDVREALLRDFETNSRQNGYLLGQISARYQHGEDPAGLLQIPDRYRRLTAADIQQAARKYLDTSNHVKVLLFPEPPTEELQVLEAARLPAAAR